MMENIVVRVASGSEINKCLKIRKSVFIEEQNVPKDRELDGLDSAAIHFLVLLNNKPVGTARVILKDNSQTAKIQRVAILKSARGSGLGQVLIKEIEKTPALQSVLRFALESQTHALGFYTRLGYNAEGPEFLDANIPHRLMAKTNISTQP